MKVSESLSVDTISYRPNESVMAWVPLLLLTNTSFTGIILVESYTVPLMVNCPIAEPAAKNRKKTMQYIFIDRFRQYGLLNTIIRYQILFRGEPGSFNAHFAFSGGPQLLPGNVGALIYESFVP